MRWLLTVPKQVDLDAVRNEVESVGASLEAAKPVPLGPDEQVLYAEGPDDLHKLLESTPTPIKASPHSEPSLYEPGSGSIA